MIQNMMNKLERYWIEEIDAVERKKDIMKEK